METPNLLKAREAKEKTKTTSNIIVYKHLSRLTTHSPQLHLHEIPLNLTHQKTIVITISAIFVKEVFILLYIISFLVFQMHENTHT